MNNPTDTPLSPNELVLRLIGGKQDGQLHTVANEKCLLSDLSPIENAEDYRCVIFRGEKGVAFRSYSDHVLCNGAKVSVQWLKKGDLIKLTDNFSVEVYQLGVYKKKTAPPAASRQPTHTVELPGKATPASSNAATAPARPITTTVPTSSASPATAPATGLTPVAPPKDYATPSVRPLSVSPLTTGEAPKFKPATANLRTPSVTAPLTTHKVPTETPAPAPSVSRMPVVNQALKSSAAGTSSSSGREVHDQSLQTQSSPVAPAVTSPIGIPATPTNSTIDSLSERLSRLVDSAGKDGKSEFEGSASASTPPADRPSVSPLDTGHTAAQTTPAPPAAPVVGATDDGASTDASPQPAGTDSATQRRAALENYFSKSGVSLSDAAPDAADNVAVAAPVSPAAAPAPSVAPPVLSGQAVAEQAITTSPLTEKVSDSVAKDTGAKDEAATSPEFDLNSVLAKLESGAETAPPQVPVAEQVETPPSPVASAPIVQPPVASAPIVQPPIASAPVVQPPVAQTAVAQPPVEPENNKAASDGDQGSQLESFALLQSLGLDTSGLGQIKKELTEAPTQEAVEPVPPSTEQPTAPQASESEKVESVADVLARMQNAGSLQDFNAGEAEADSSAPETAPRETPTPSPASSPAAAAAESSPGSNEQGGGSAGGSEDDGSVEDYMSQLLNRMRGDSEPTSGEVAEQKQDQTVEKIAAAQQASAASTGPEKVEKLTPEEFVPKQKAVRMQSLDSLREIANSNAREAFRDSLARERKVSTKTKLTLSMASLAFAVLFVLLSYVGDKVNFWGVVFGLGFLIIGLLTARAYLSERKLDESILSD